MWDVRQSKDNILAKYKGGPGSGHHGHAGRPGKQGGSAPSSGAVGRIRSIAADVSGYLGVGVDPSNVQIMDRETFKERFVGEFDVLTGEAAATTLRDGSVVISEGYENYVTHELVHQAGMMPDGVGRFLNEGVTQSATQEIGRNYGHDVAYTYQKETNFVEHYVVPTVGVSRRNFYQGYAKARDKGQYVADLVWKAHGSKFSNADDWGKTPKSGLTRELKAGDMIGTSIYLMYLVDELGVGKVVT